MNNKFRNIRDDFANSVEREEVTVIINSNQNNQINQNADRLISRSRFKTSESSSRAITQSSENQVNFINCYNCDKFDNLFRICRQYININSDSFVREMNVHDKNDSSSENLEIESRKE